MLVRYDLGSIFAPIMRLFGGGGDSGPKYFNTGPSAADTKAADEKAAQDAKNKSLADQANKQGAANSLITAADSGAGFGALKTRKTLLGGT